MSSASDRSMPRFPAVDGLRSWMAWVVVFGHVLQQAFPYNVVLGDYDIGGHAVDVFIIISGFVITHLLIERPGPYLAYLVPRFMRLFPAFLVSCMIGAATYAIAREWAQPDWFDGVFGKEWRSMASYWPQHLIAHLTMLHGAIPNTLLPWSQYAFNPPGWSVSLEWQFYTVAPLAIWLANSRSRSWALVAIVVLMALAYHFAVKGHWDRPSVLIGTGKFFLIGIACRYAAPYIAGAVHHAAAIGVGLLFTLGWIGSPSVAIWLLIFSFVLRADHPAQGVEGLYVRIMRALFESRPVLYLADRSYSTYLLHWPLLMLIGTAATWRGVPTGMPLALWMLLVVPLTLLLQEPLYRLVEEPARKLGKRWSASLRARPSGDPRSRSAVPL